jgi:hypothetical protein
MWNEGAQKRNIHGCYGCGTGGACKNEHRHDTHSLIRIQYISGPVEIHYFPFIMLDIAF